MSGFGCRYIRVKKESLRSDSNRRPTDYESVALPTAPLRLNDQIIIHKEGLLFKSEMIA